MSIIIENSCMQVHNHILLYWVLFIQLIVNATETTHSDIHLWVLRCTYSRHMHAG